MARLTCAVPYRRRGDGAEFLLVTPAGATAWRFPNAAFADGTNEEQQLCALVEDEIGLQGALSGEPLAEFEVARSAGADVLVAYLLEVAQDGSSACPRVRTRWCLPEEARIRIRRKPLRRLVDLALHRLQLPAI